MPVLTNGEATYAREALGKLLKVKLPAKTAYKVARLAREVDQAVQDAERVRMGRLDQLGQHNEDGSLAMDERGAVLFPDDASREEFAEFYRALMAETTEYRWMITVEELGLTSVEPGDLLALGQLLVADEEEQPK